MKKTVFLTLVAALAFSMSACHNGEQQNERQLTQITISDTTLEQEGLLTEITWQDGRITSLHKNNPYETIGTRFAESYFDYTLNFTYEGDKVVKYQDHKFYITVDYEGDRIKEMNQYTLDSNIHMYQVIFNYEGDDVVKVTRNSISHDAILWLEALLYNRIDSTGVPVRLERPSDLELSPSMYTTWHMQNGNMIANETEYLRDSLTVNTTLEYDDKINPFYNNPSRFDHLDMFTLLQVYGDNDCGISKNNVVKATVHTGEMEYVLDYSYEYDGDYPIVKNNTKMNSKEHYHYNK